MSNKKRYGQFYTNKNIFDHKVFIDWFSSIPKEKKEIVLEPFAGSNGIIKFLQDLNLIKGYKSYDISPMSNEVEKKDTIKDFPRNFRTIVTNPPFLAKNSAKRKNVEIDIGDFYDLYEKCLELCLKNCDYLAAIVPDSFITNQKIDKSRLHAVISLQSKKIFKETEHPVCLALFNKESSSDFNIYINDTYIGAFNELKNKELNFLNKPKKERFEVIWHNKSGEIGLKTIDATLVNKKMSFIEGFEIDEDQVNKYSRLRTRIKIIDKESQKKWTKKEIKNIVQKLNIYLDEYRNETHDLFLTSFKGLRSDTRYRRRLDFVKGRKIVDSFFSNYDRD